MIGWLDCSAGISGDMLLGALVDAGVELALVQKAVDAVVPGVRLTRSDVTRAGIGACKIDVETLVADPPTRSWTDVRALLQKSSLAPPVRERALNAFARLAEAEAAVHRVAVEDVHFHEVGALDAIADIVGAAAGLEALGLTYLAASAVTVGSGSARGAHGLLPVPVPAVLALLTGAPIQAGPVSSEMTTPTGAALLAANVSAYGPMPPMMLLRTGVGAGGRDPGEIANVLRLLLGEPTKAEVRTTSGLVLEANIDDLDPRAWPGILQTLLDAGAEDAWLTPILMKKGRPAHTLAVLCVSADAERLRRLVFAHTSTLGIREREVDKRALDRTQVLLDVDGQPVRLKLGWLDGAVVNAMPEWEDVAEAARALGRPVKQVLAQAHGLAQTFTPDL